MVQQTLETPDQDQRLALEPQDFAAIEEDALEDELAFLAIKSRILRRESRASRAARRRSMRQRRAR